MGAQFIIYENAYSRAACCQVNCLVVEPGLKIVYFMIGYAPVKKFPVVRFSRKKGNFHCAKITNQTLALIARC